MPVPSLRASIFGPLLLKYNKNSVYWSYYIIRTTMVTSLKDTSCIKVPVTPYDLTMGKRPQTLSRNNFSTKRCIDIKIVSIHRSIPESNLECQVGCRDDGWNRFSIGWTSKTQLRPAAMVGIVFLFDPSDSIDKKIRSQSIFQQVSPVEHELTKGEQDSGKPQYLTERGTSSCLVYKCTLPQVRGVDTFWIRTTVSNIAQQL